MVSNKQSTRAQWKSRWSTSRSRKRLQKEWHNNFEAYMAAFDMDQDGTPDMLQQGMTYFRRLETMPGKRRHLRRKKFYRFAREIIESLVESNSTEGRSDCVFVSLDIEGNLDVGITEIGWAILDVRDLYGEKPVQEIVATYNMKVSKGERGVVDKKFLFGETDNIRTDALVSTVQNIFNLDDDRCPGRKRTVILLGHSAFNDVTMIEGFGITLDSMPTIKGVVDTNLLAQRYLGGSLTLQRVLERLDVPHIICAMHCAGNDAHYTVKAFAAMMARRMEEPGIWEELAKDESFHVGLNKFGRRIELFPMERPRDWIDDRSSKARKEPEIEVEDITSDCIELLWS